MIRKKNRHSIYFKVMMTNSVVALFFICIFLFNFQYSRYKFDQETSAYSNEILDTLTKGFNAEAERLAIFADQCTQDKALVMAASNRLSLGEFSNYASETSKRLQFAQNSLPYAKQIFVYVRNNKTFIFTNAIVTKDQILSQGDHKLSAEMLEINYDSLQTGFYLEGTDCFYVSSIRNYGLLVVQLDTSEFCNLRATSAVLPDYEIAVLGSDNQLFFGSSENIRQLLKLLGGSTENIRKIAYGETEYRITTQPASNGFRFMLFGKPSEQQKSQNFSNMISIAVWIVVFLISFVLVLLNERIYSPLKNVVKKISENDSGLNEFDLISGKIDKLINDNAKMNEAISLQQTNQLDIELSYAFHTNQVVSGRLCESLQNQYEQYKVMVLALQDQDGNGDEFLPNIDNYFADTLESRMVPIDSFVHAYVIPAACHADKITEEINKSFESMALGTMAFIGVSDDSSDFSQIQALYSQAYERMACNRFPRQKKYAVCMSGCGTDAGISGVMSYEKQDMIAKCVLGGANKNLENILSQVFFSDCEMTLKNSVACYRQLSELLLTLLSSSNSDLCAGDLKTTAGRPVYHPVLMYHLLLKDFEKLSDCNCQEHSPMKYQITDYLRQHYNEPLSLDSVSSVFGITPVYLSSWFKKNTGINFSVYLSNIRIQQAKRILEENRHMKISDVAVKIGIPSAAAFIRKFKNCTGSTPEQYRQCNSEIRGKPGCPGER